MKVIAKTDNNYICEVSHNEIEKYLNKYFNRLNRLKIGDIIDLGKGHDFWIETKTALKTTEEFISKNKKTINTILTGISIAGKND